VSTAQTDLARLAGQQHQGLALQQQYAVLVYHHGAQGRQRLIRTQADDLGLGGGADKQRVAEAQTLVEVDCAWPRQAKCSSPEVYFSDLTEGLQHSLSNASYVRVYKDKKWMPEIKLLEMCHYICQTCGYLETYLKDLEKLAALATAPTGTRSAARRPASDQRGIGGDNHNQSKSAQIVRFPRRSWGCGEKSIAFPLAQKSSGNAIIMAPVRD